MHQLFENLSLKIIRSLKIFRNLWMVVLAMRRHTQYNSPFHYLVSNSEHIYLERIVNTLFHLQRCHQNASPSTYGVHLLFSFVFIFLIWVAHVEQVWIWLMIIFFWCFDNIIGTCMINYILPKRNHNLYLLILLQYHEQALVILKQRKEHNCCQNT